MNFKSLAKQSKETKKSKKTGKNLSKKRFGKSIANRAPAMFITMLEQKVKSVGGVLYKSETQKIKASQVDHETQKYKKKELKERFHTLQDGTQVQRDLYAAFIEEHVDEENDIVDFEACKRDFPAFKIMHDAEMKRLSEYTGYLPASVGIKRKK